MFAKHTECSFLALHFYMFDAHEEKQDEPPELGGWVTKASSMLALQNLWSS